MDVIQLFILCISIIMINTQLYEPEDQPLLEAEPKLIQQPAGREVKIRCGIRNNQTEYLGTPVTKWFFKPCNIGFNRVQCTNKEEIEKTPWTVLNCDGEPCQKPTLTIKNSTESDSGLYNCRLQSSSVNNETAISLSKTFYLEVIDSTIQPPEFVGNYPANVTATLGNQVVFQCRIHSKVPPTIKWLRRIDTISPETSVHFQYDNANTEDFQARFGLLESSGEKELTGDTHLSKLIINNVSEKDVGVYVCVGINAQGFKYREAYLSLSQDLESRGANQFILLFLIPVCFISIPLLIWSCYAYVRFRRQQKIGNKTNFGGVTKKPMFIRHTYKRQQTRTLVIYEI